jgi:hypothetical protein
MNREEWDKNHAACPQCGKSTNISQTLAGAIEVDGHYHDSINSALCKNCGWSGKVELLIPAEVKPEAEKAKDLTVEIKTIDVNNESYACIKDLLSTVQNFNHNLCEQLKDDSTKRYTASILDEVTSMLATVDMQHWANKHQMNADKAVNPSPSDQTTE